MTQINAGRVRFVSRGEYNNSTQYYLFDLVNYNGNSYYAKENTLGNLPTDASKWQLIAEKGSTGSTGPTGATGNGISSITKISSVDTTDTYRITFTDGTTYDYEITNGEVSQAQLDELQAQLDRYKMLENALPHITGTGTELTLNNTANAGMTIDLEPNTSQESTPSTDYPQDIHVVSGDNTLKVGNKNLLPNYNPYPYEISRGVTFTKNSDGTYTLNGINDNTGNSALFLVAESDNPLVLEAGTYYTIATNVQGVAITGYDGTNYVPMASKNINSFTLENDTTFVQVYIQRGKGYTAQLDNVIVYPIISKTSIDESSYEPHEEQAVNIPLGVKNFLNIDNSESGGINAQGELTTGNTTWRANSFIKVQPNTTYTFSRKQFNDNVQRAIRLYEYNSNQSFITPRAESYEKTLTITTSANTYYLKWSIFENQANFTKSIVETWNLQIELGTKANSYSPYGQEPLEYCKIGNYKDKFYLATASDTGLTAGKWYLKKNIPEYVFTGNEDIVNAATSNGYRIRINNAINYPPISVSEVADILCNYYLPKSANDTYLNRQGIAFASTGNTIFIYDTAYDYENSATDYKAYLQEKYNSGNPVKAKYVTETPEYILLNNTLQEALNTLKDKLLAYKGQTSISQINNDLPFNIVASALKDISNL